MPWRRALIVWLLLAAVEIAHGALRTVFLVPVIGDWRARQIGAVIGSILIVIVALLTVKAIGAPSRRVLLGVGLFWLALMLTFEIAAGRWLAGFTWERIASDYDLSNGGLLGLGMIVLALSPLIAARVRGLT